MVPAAAVDIIQGSWSTNVSSKFGGKQVSILFTLPKKTQEPCANNIYFITMRQLTRFSAMKSSMPPPYTGDFLSSYSLPAVFKPCPNNWTCPWEEAQLIPGLPSKWNALATQPDPFHSSYLHSPRLDQFSFPHFLCHTHTTIFSVLCFQ